MKTQPLHQMSGELTFTSERKLPQASLSSKTKRILFLLAACIVLTMTAYGIVMPVFAKRLGELGSGLQALGLMTMSFAFAQFLLSPFMGSFADRFGRRPVILIVLAGEVIANGAYLGCGAANKLICYSEWKRGLPLTEQYPFKWRHFQAEIILLCVRGYLRYPLSYRDLEEIMLERGLHVDHRTIYRWLQQYAPQLEQRCRPHVRTTTDSWRVDETSIKVKKAWVYLYRAVDSQGNTLDFWLSSTRDGEAAKRFFLITLAAAHTTEPRVITVDKNAAYPKAFNELKVEGRIPEGCELRQVKYLKNLVEQDHRAHQTLDEAWDGLFLLRDGMENLTGI